MAEQNIERLNAIELFAVEATVQKLTIVDGLGNPGIIAECDQFGPVLRLVDSKGVVKIMLRVVDEGPVITLFDETDEHKFINLHVERKGQ